MPLAWGTLGRLANGRGNNGQEVRRGRRHVPRVQDQLPLLDLYNGSAYNPGAIRLVFLPNILMRVPCFADLL